MKTLKIKKHFFVKDYKCKTCTDFVFVGLKIQKNCKDFEEHKNDVISSIKGIKHGRLLNEIVGRSPVERGIIFNGLIMGKVMYAARSWMPKSRKDQIFEIQKEINIAINQMQNNYGIRKKSVNKIRAELGIKSVTNALHEAMCKRVLKHRIQFLEEVNDSYGRQRSKGLIKMRSDGKNFDRKIFNMYGGKELFEKKNFKQAFTKKLKSISTKMLEFEKKFGALPKPPNLKFFDEETLKLY